MANRSRTVVRPGYAPLHDLTPAAAKQQGSPPQRYDTFAALQRRQANSRGSLP